MLKSTTDKDGEKMQQSATTTDTVVTEKCNNKDINFSGHLVQDENKKVVDLTPDTWEQSWQQDAMLQFSLDIHIPDESDSEPENDFPTHFIHELNEWLTLWVSNTENYLYGMDEEYTFSKDLKGISLNVVVIKHGKKEASYLLIRNFCVASKVKLEHTP